MAKKGGDVLFRLLGDDTHLKKSMQGVKTGFAGLAKSLSSMPMAGILGGVSLGGTLAMIAGNALELDKAAFQMNAALKSTGGVAGLTAIALKELAVRTANTTTSSKSAVMEAENLLLTFTNIKGEVYSGALAAVLDMSTAMGQDLRQSSLQLGKALNDPIRGMGALSEIGVTFSNSQRTAIQTMVESGQTMMAQRMILNELSREFGGSAAAGVNTLSGAYTRLKNTISDAGAAAMAAKLGIATNALNAASDILSGQATTPVVEPGKMGKANNWVMENVIGLPVTASLKASTWLRGALDNVGENLYQQDLYGFKQAHRRLGLSDKKLESLRRQASSGLLEGDEAQHPHMISREAQRIMQGTTVTKEAQPTMHGSTTINNVTIGNANFRATDDMVKRYGRQAAMSPGV